MNHVISYLTNLHPLSFMGYHILSTTVIYILVNIIIAKTRPTENTTAVPAPYSISPSFLAWLRNSATSVIQLAMFRLLRKTMSLSSILRTIFNSAPISSTQNAK